MACFMHFNRVVRHWPLAVALYLTDKHECGFNLLIQLSSRKQISIFSNMSNYFFNSEVKHIHKHNFFLGIISSGIM